MLYNKPKYSCIFDNGESMQCSKLSANLNFYTGSGKFFTNKDFDDMLLSICSGIKRINLHNLDGLSALYKDMLKKYQVFVFYVLTRPLSLCILFKQPFEVYYAIY